MSCGETPSGSRAFRAALRAALALALSAGLWGCAHMGAGSEITPARDLERAFNERRASAALNAEGILASASLQYADSGKKHRLTLKLWGSPDLPLRMDLSAGIGSTVAMLLEKSEGWTGYFPSEKTAFASDSALFGQRALGMDLPFTLLELAGLVTGTYTGFAPRSLPDGKPAPNGGARYIFSTGGSVTGMTLDAEGKPVVFAGRLRGRAWTMTLSRHAQTKAAPPARMDIILEPDVRATLRIKRLERRGASWPDRTLELPLPPGTTVTPWTRQPNAGEAEMPETKNDMETPRNKDEITGNILDTLKTGLKVLASELKWTFTDMVRNYESKQMRRRLKNEYAALGKLTRARMDAGEDAPPSRDGEAGIVLSQIEFLEQEIGFMDEDRDRSRVLELQRRKRDLGLEDDR